MAVAGVGISMLELSHRSGTFDDILENAIADIRELGNIPRNYKVLMLQGGASLQFSMVPMNLLTQGKTADYIDAGSWGAKAIKEAQRVAKLTSPATTKPD